MSGAGCFAEGPAPTAAGSGRTIQLNHECIVTAQAGVGGGVVSLLRPRRIRAVRAAAGALPS